MDRPRKLAAQLTAALVVVAGGLFVATLPAPIPAEKLAAIRAARVCVEVHPIPLDAPRGVARLALDSTTYWPNGSHLSVAFAPGTSPTLAGRIMADVSEWSRYANIEFVATPSWQGAEVRVAFIQGQGSYAYIGKGGQLVDPSEHTVNLGWLDDSTPDEEVRRVSLHEFGHVLGAIHEQQQPSSSIEWDVPAVLAFYEGPPNFWSQQLVYSQVIDRDTRPGIQYSRFDGSSIMEYPVDPALTGGRISIGMNTDLSTEDKAFIGTIYPFPTEPPIVVQPGMPPPPPVAPPAVDARTANRLKLLASINAHRARRGQQPLEWADLFPGDPDPRDDP